MKTTLDCIPCFARQALDAARYVTDDVAIQERILRSVLRQVADMDLSQSPPVVAQKVHRNLRRITGIEDPYREIKDRYNEMALRMMPDLRVRMEKTNDPLFFALRFAVAGNVIDLGVKGGIGEDEVRSALDNTLQEPFHGDREDFRHAVLKARNILYLADNAGEIVFDRLLIERLLPKRIVLAVRGTPVLNDATRIDAEGVGLSAIVEVIDNGSDAPGTILNDCSEDFRSRFFAADLIIAKGQGNFETLSEADADIYFLFKAKCPVLADHVGLPLGTHVAIRRCALVQNSAE
jgi:damage-control phosphatase, subfamily I